jgi:hypothetical protein
MNGPLNAHYQQHQQAPDLASESLAHRLFQLLAGDFALGHDAVVNQHDGHAPVVEVVHAIVGVDISELRLMAEGTEMGEGLIAEVAALAGHQDQPHDRLARQPEGLPHLDRRPVEPVGLLDVFNTDPNIIRRIVLGRDRPQRVTRLDYHRRVTRRLAAAPSSQRKADADQEDGGDCRQQSPHRPGAAGSGCPPRIDSDTGDVHTFGKIANARSRVKRSNKGLRWPT